MGGSRCQARLSPFQLLFFKRQRKEKNKTAEHPQPKPLSVLWAADMSFLYPTTKRHQGASEGPWNGLAQPGPATPLRLAVNQGPAPRGQTDGLPLHKASLIARHGRCAIAQRGNHSPGPGR